MYILNIVCELIGASFYLHYVTLCELCSHGTLYVATEAYTTKMVEVPERAALLIQFRKCADS